MIIKNLSASRMAIKVHGYPRIVLAKNGGEHQFQNDAEYLPYRDQCHALRAAGKMDITHASIVDLADAKEDIREMAVKADKERMLSQGYTKLVDDEE